MQSLQREITHTRSEKINHNAKQHKIPPTQTLCLKDDDDDDDGERSRIRYQKPENMPRCKNKMSLRRKQSPR
jgi:hypothetical protein